MTKVAYHKYFGCDVGDQDRDWALHICCQTCAVNLNNWLNGKCSSMSFAHPMIWRESTNHFNDCYFCITKVSGFSRKSKHNIDYPDISSAIRPVLYGESFPVQPVNWEKNLEMYDDKTEPDNVLEKEGSYFSESEEKLPYLIEQAELNDLVPDLHLLKEHAELLGSRLQQWNLLATGIKETIFRNCNQQQPSFFTMQNKMCVCVNPSSVLEVVFWT